MTDFIATCPRGLEYPLQEELRSLGLTGLHETRGGITFTGAIEDAWRACLWSRTASRVLMPLATAPVADADGLYEVASSIDWAQWLKPGCRFAVGAASRHKEIRNTHFAALRVKDAIVDQRDRAVVIDTERPELRIYAFADAETATVGLDLATRPLHQRGYRQRSVVAPLRENLAAALLWRANWPDAAALLDPVCGSGTLLIEAAWMAADVAPGLLNPNFGFLALPDFDEAAWRALLGEARERRKAGLAAMMLPITGYDADEGAVRAARDNASRAGVGHLVAVERRAIRDFLTPTAWPDDGGLIVANPPYGERLDPGERGLFELYRLLGEGCADGCPGSRMAVLTAHDELARQIDWPLADRYRVFNGPLPCRWFVFDPPARADITDGARMVSNRIAKNRKRLGRYFADGSISCYRAYDADIPEYAVAVDVYGDRLHVQEYQAPASIPEATTRRRLEEAIAGARHAFDVGPGAVFVKARARQRGSRQYERLSDEGAVSWVEEDGLRLRVNLSDYLDTGLFLDHRETRRRVRGMAAGKSFLNLFCYTGSVSVHAAAGGASRTLSVDLSKTYLDWAEENLRRNGFHDANHRLLRADCLQWLETAEQRFDVIFLDPPTFSNSKAMRRTFDVQDDHVWLLEKAVGLLEPGGVLIFSNNARRFALDESITERMDVEDITAATTPPDFSRKRPHRCWEIRAGDFEPRKTLALGKGEKRRNPYRKGRTRR
ncbi:MAG: bifunctional 23S rRNA (guanine(2069)-N(7))-methyltransferase RlmK/23S rRNA (guanine(2445)-N(2))-methyltransferase RlmL [Pseudomonadota bacterium]